MFIAIEGMDGTGKSTQIELLRKKIQATGKELILTREPGGTAIGEAIRQILLSPNNKEMAPETEALLYASSRAQLVSEVIFPALKEGKIIISDRYVVSSYVYQGIARELGVESIMEINQFGIKHLMPDLTIFLVLEQSEALSRKRKQKQLDRLEAESVDFHQKVHQGFLEIAKSYSLPKLVLPANQSPEQIHLQIWEKVKERIDFS